MPGKVNPVMVENLSMICYHVIGNDTAVAWCASRGQLELNVMMPMIAHEVIEALSVLATGCSQFAVECVAGIEADVERCRMLLEQSSAMATPLAPYIGYALAARAWGNGYATEGLRLAIAHAFGPIGLERLEADIDPRNDASCRLVERVGFRREGLLRQRWRVADEVTDSAIYGLLRAEYRPQ